MTLDQRAQNVRTQLFDRYDQLNALWQKAEERLTKNHIPRPVEHIYSEFDLVEGDPNAGIGWHCLGLQKIKGKWRICHGTYCYSQSGPDDWTPIVDCAAPIRVRTTKYLLDLEEAAMKSAETFVPVVDEAIKTLAKVLGHSDNLAELLAERAKLNGNAH
jgi:hypothetical protein